MFMCKRAVVHEAVVNKISWLVGIALFCFTCNVANAASDSSVSKVQSVVVVEVKTHYGRSLSPNEIVDITPLVFADGRGLPAGAGNAMEGELLYAQHCADCHGNVGQGGRAVELIGDRSLLATPIPDKGIGVYWPYAPPLFEYIRRAMPPSEPYSLEPNEVYAIVAYLFEISGLIDVNTQLDAEVLAGIVMPNLHGFRSPFEKILAHSRFFRGESSQ